ncbi:uncharacterized protein RBU33_016999 isoform 3-T3 [Hipposideros larvatus]
MLREVSSGVLKRPSLASVYFNIFNLDEDMEVLEGGKSEIKAQIQSLAWQCVTVRQISRRPLDGRSWRLLAAHTSCWPLTLPASHTR